MCQSGFDLRTPPAIRAALGTAGPWWPLDVGFQLPLLLAIVPIFPNFVVCNITFLGHSRYINEKYGEPCIQNSVDPAHVPTPPIPLESPHAETAGSWGLCALIARCCVQSILCSILSIPSSWAAAPWKRMPRPVFWGKKASRRPTNWYSASCQLVVWMGGLVVKRDGFPFKPTRTRAKLQIRSTN